MGTSLNWCWIGASACGTSHSLSQQECQDHFEANVITLNSSEVFYCFVSDGAGSASHSKLGAERCCKSAVELLQGLIVDKDPQAVDSEKLAYVLVEGVVEQLHDYAQKLKIAPRELACTFLGVVCFQHETLFFQVGDGAIVHRSNDLSQTNYLPAFWPDYGEYANETNFVTYDSALNFLRVKAIPASPTRIAVFSDGLQRLSLKFDSLEVHAPFFDPMFAKLDSVASSGYSLSLSLKLTQFLNSSQVNSRTDDDKTLVLASRRFTKNE